MEQKAIKSYTSPDNMLSSQSASLELLILLSFDNADLFLSSAYNWLLNSTNNECNCFLHALQLFLPCKNKK